MKTCGNCSKEIKKGQPASACKCGSEIFCSSLCYYSATDHRKICPGKTAVTNYYICFLVIISFDRIFCLLSLDNFQKRWFLLALKWQSGHGYSKPSWLVAICRFDSLVTGITSTCVMFSFWCVTNLWFVYWWNHTHHTKIALN